MPRGVTTAAEAWSALAEQAWRRGQDEGDAGVAVRWLQRTHRIAPADHTIALSLALAFLRVHDPAQAATLFRSVSAAHDVAEAWIGLAASLLRLGDPAGAVDAIGHALTRHVAAPATIGLARRIAAATEVEWCCIGEAGELHASGPARRVALDGVAWQPSWSSETCRLPPRWRHALRLDVTTAGRPALGSPLDLRAITAVEGCVETHAGGIRGWAWHPGDPGRSPRLMVAGKPIVAATPVTGSTNRPLARPRGFTIEAASLPPGLVHVTSADGRDVLGSPLDPGVEQRSAAGLSDEFRPVWADTTFSASNRTTRARVAAIPRPNPVAIVIPAYRGVATTLACLRSVFASVPPGTAIHVIDDASPEPELVAALTELAQAGRIHLTRHPRNRGFPAAANAGIAASAGHDVVLLNSDTLTPPGWLERLQAAAYAAVDIGTACPLSNDATILSYPRVIGGNPVPDLLDTMRVAALAARANGDAVLDIPTAVGSCMYIRRDCLDQVGMFREDLFAQGYGEENDFCLRASHRGWCHVAVPGAFVAHLGAASFGAAQAHLTARNMRVLNRLHPGYDDLIARFVAADPLAHARRRIDALRWRDCRRAASVILVTHAGGGGVDRLVAARCAAFGAAGLRPIVLRPDGRHVTVADGTGPDIPNLRYALPNDAPALLRLLRPDQPTHVELHHLLGHPASVTGLAERLGIPHDVHVHDYAWFCPRIALLGGDRRYCGEPDIAGCEACVADHGSLLEEEITVSNLVARSTRLLGSARQVVTASPDAAARLRRHFPFLQPAVTPWEDDAAIPPPPPPREGGVHLCVIGGIGIEKGFDILLACVRDVAARRLPLRFTVVGHTADDARLLEAGPVFITGSYVDADVVALVRTQAATLAWLPSIWPETWCYTLGHAWRAGLRASVFDIGAPALRVRGTGWGWVLPLGLPPGAINDAHLRLAASNAAVSRVAPGRAASHSPLVLII